MISYPPAEDSCHGSIPFSKPPFWISEPEGGGCGVGVFVGFVVGDGTGVLVAVGTGVGVSVAVAVGLTVGDGLGVPPPAISRAIL